MTDNLHLYVTAEDYAAVSGPSWPTYQDYILGVQATDSEIQKEIDSFTKMFLENGIKFPIETATACQYKWAWSTIYLNMLSTASCHRAGIMKFSESEFDNFHNLPKKINDRKIMLQGNWPQGGCQSCEMIERAGGFSDRMSGLQMRGLLPPELITNPTETKVTPTILEIFAENTCNLSCIYCNASLSSKIEQENIKFGPFASKGISIPVTTVERNTTGNYFKLFMQWLEKNVKNLKRLHLLGGETFIQHDLMNGVLDILEKNPAPDLVLCTFSNLNVPDKYWKKYTDRIQYLCQQGNISKFELTASIDCWGEAASYTRFGLNLDKFEQRLAWAAEQSDTWLGININQTITSTAIKTMPELIEKIAQYSEHRHIGHYFQFVGPNGTIEEINGHLHPKQFAYSLWEKDFDRILKAMPQNTHDQRDAIPRMQGHQKLLQQVTSHNYKKIADLHVYLDEIDRRRGSAWRQIFPYLDINDLGSV